MGLRPIASPSPPRRRTSRWLAWGVALSTAGEVWKGVSDPGGRGGGDRARRDPAVLLRRAFRDSDRVAGIGGDEYAVLVRRAGPESAGVLADRMKRQVREFNRRAGRGYELSVSLGFATHTASTLGSVAGLLDRADQALYRG